ncbi:MAG: hypothetical protein ABFS03_11475 [Chloroflexota bacterium]
MSNVFESHHFPKLDRISLLAATILLTYYLTGFIDLPTFELKIPVPGVYLAIPIDITSLIAIFIMGITSSGVDWLLRGHPAISGHTTIQHWLLPTLTAWGIGTSLAQQPIGPIWWVAFGFGSGFLIIIMIAEYISVDPNDIRYAPAAITLRAVAFVLYLVLLITLRAQAVRLVAIIPTITIAMGLVSLRVLHLRLNGIWAWVPTLIIMLLMGEIATVLHYLPISPITFSLVLLGLAYALVSLASNIIENKSHVQLLLEPIAALTIIIGIAFWLQ